MPIIILSEDAEFKAEFSFKRQNIFVMAMWDYLQTFWPDLTAAHSLYESLSAALVESSETGGGESY